MELSKYAAKKARQAETGNGKSVCSAITKFKDDDVKAFGDIIRKSIKSKFDEINF